MIVLGIDPGLALTGWGLIEKKDPPRLIDYGCIKTKKSLPQEKRFLKIYTQLAALIKKYQPQVMCLEKVFFSKNAKTALVIGEARGVAKTSALLKKINIVEFTPLQIKMAITGYGRADKNQVQHMIKVLLSLDQIPRRIIHSGNPTDMTGVVPCNGHRLPVAGGEFELAGFDLL